VKHNAKRYGFRWRMFYRNDGKWLEPFRVRFSRTFFMLEIVWDRLTWGPGGKKWLYIVIPGIVDVNDHNWGQK
jgi:hypothetical protein